MQNVCFDYVYSNLSETLSFQKEFSKILWIISLGLHMKRSIFLSDFNQAWIFSIYFNKSAQHTISQKPVL